jgi:hypothetical protein
VVASSLFDKIDYGTYIVLCLFMLAILYHYCGSIVVVLCKYFRVLPWP